MITHQYQITNALVGEIDDHFTPSDEEPTSRAGLVIDRAQRQHGLLTFYGVDQETRLPFTATIRVRVQVMPSTQDDDAPEQAGGQSS